MVFNPEVHQIKLIIIKCGEELRKIKGLPEEKNITVLYEETSIALGIPTIPTTTRDANHISFPSEMEDEKGKFIVPKKDCPNCEGNQTVNLFYLCATCTDAEGGKYKSKWECSKCGHKDISEKAFVQWLDELGIDFQPGMKRDMGIKTSTDTGLK